MLSVILIISLFITTVHTQRCEDTEKTQTCEAWKKFTYCKKFLNKPEHYKYMKANCSRTCGFCSVSSHTSNVIDADCTDKIGEEQCKRWATQTVCESGHMYYETMKKHCPLTCMQCTVDRSWSSWSPWSHCIVSCGGEGVQTRQRQCLSTTNGAPQEGCKGEKTDMQTCYHNEC